MPKGTSLPHGDRYLTPAAYVLHRGNTAIMFERSKFEVSIHIDKLTNMPYSSGKAFVTWNVSDSPRPETRGRTASAELHRNTGIFDRWVKFPQRIGMRTPSNTLRRTDCVFTVVWEPLGSRGMTIGEITLDLAQFVGSNGESQSFLLENARANCLLTVGIQLKHVRGPSNYRVPEFTAPVVHKGFEDNSDDNKGESSQGHGSHNHQHHRHRTNHRVLAQIRDDILSDLSIHSSTLSATESMSDLLKGGDGFLGAAAPPADDDPRENHKKGTPYTESAVRDNFVSWKLLV